MSSALVRLLAVATAVLPAATCRNEPSSPPMPARPTPSAAERARSFGLEVRPSDSEGVPIRVVDAASGRPVADALIVAADESEFTYTDTEIGMPAADALLRDCGTAYATSPDGTVTVAPSDWPQVVFVWSGRDFGRETLEVHDRAEHVIRVAPRELVVEVVDPEGRPQAGVPILLGKCSLALEEPGTLRGVTGADGQCAITALDLEQGVHRTCGRRDLLMVDGVVRTWILREVATPILEPVRFVLPPCGSLVVEVQDVHGKRLNALGQQLLATVSGQVPGEAIGIGRHRSYSRSRSIQVAVSDGRFQVERVEVGMVLSFRLFEVEQEPEGFGVQLRDLDCDVVGRPGVDEGSVLGPTKPGEIVSVVLKTEIDPTAMPVEEAPKPPIGLDSVPASPASSAEKEPLSSIALGVITDVPIDPCTLRVRIDNITDPNEHNACAWIDVTGRATARGIVPGRHSVAIVTSGFDGGGAEVPLARFDDVEVRAKEHLRDPRLLSIDLRGKLTRHHLEIVDDEGQRLSGRILHRNGGNLFEDRFEDGLYDTVTATSETHRVLFLTERHAPLELDSLPEHARLVMKRGIPIRVVLDPRATKPKLPLTELYVGVPELARVGEEEQDQELRTVRIEPGGSATFVIPEPGDWRVIFVARKPDDGGEVEDKLLAAIEPTIHVVDSVDEQVFTVAPVSLMKEVLGESDEPASSDGED